MKRAATVFVAEDNQSLLEGLQRALLGHGYQVRTAPDGRAMLALLERTPDPPDLLLLDVMMPEMSGIEVLRAVRGDPRWSHLPVMLITASQDGSLPASALQGGAAELLVKPFRLSDLLARVECNLRSR